MTPELNQDIANLTPEQQKLFAKLLEKEGLKAPSGPIAKAPISGTPIATEPFTKVIGPPLLSETGREAAEKSEKAQLYPLSFAQERLWFLHQLDPHSPAYNVFVGVKLKGKLDVVALQQCLAQVVERQTALRTLFTQVEGEPRQQLMPDHELILRQVDLQDMDPTDRKAEVERLARKEAQQPFDLASGPLYRFTLLLIEPDEHIFLLNLHHIISDRWSIDLFLQEVSQLYQQALESPILTKSMSASVLSPLPIGYGDFARWQRERFTISNRTSRQLDEGTPSAQIGSTIESASDEQVQYWMTKLADAPDILDLPTDYPRPPKQSLAGQTYRQTIPSDLYHSLKNLGQSENCTLFMTMLGAVNLLLQAYTHKEDMLIGSPISGRNRHEVENLIGFFVNVMVLRTDLTGKPTFRELLRRVRGTVLEAFAHKDVPLEMLLENLTFRRDPSYSPLAQVGFSYQNDIASEGSLPGLEIELLDFTEEASKLDLTFFVEETNDELVLAIEYATALFQEATVAQMATHFIALLTKIVQQPDASLAELRSDIQRPAGTVTMSERALMANDGSNEPSSTAQDASTDSATDLVEELEARSNLTRNQLLIWIGQQYHPDVPMYNLCCTGTISGPIDPELMRQAFQALVNSVDVLRTVFYEEDGIPQQLVQEHLQFTLPFIDFSAESDPELACEAWLDKARHHQFDLHQCSFDSALLKIQPEKFVWYIHPHHIISDGFSNILLLGHLDKLYQMACAGELPNKLDLPTFADYVIQEKAQRESKRYASAKAYWAEQSSQPMEPLSFYGQTANHQVGPTTRVVHSLGEERSTRLKSVAEQDEVFSGNLDVTLYTIFSAVLLTYLHKLSGVTELAFGSPFHNRRGVTKETVGLFMHVLPVRVALDEDETFLTLLKKISTSTRTTLRYSQYTATNPMQQRAYEVVLNYHNMSLGTFNGYPVTNEAVHAGYGDESLGVRVMDLNDSGTLTLEFDFDSELFPVDVQRQAIEHFVQVIDAFIGDNQQPIAQVKLLTPAEEKQILVDFNQTAHPTPHDRLMTQLFEEQVAQAPTALAAMDRGESITYAELNARANRLAHQLRNIALLDDNIGYKSPNSYASNCVGPETLVAIFAPRSVNFLTAMLGIFKAGGAYLPLDLAHPSARLAQVIQQSECPMVLAAQESLGQISQALETLPADKRPLVMTIESLLAVEAPTSNLEPVSTPANLAYVIYTSGSTGLPKGAMVEQRGMLNHLCAKVEDLTLTSEDRIAQTASQCFDISVWQFLAALVVGGSVHIFDNEVAHHPVKLLEETGAQEITILETVPSLMRALLEDGMAVAQNDAWAEQGDSAEQDHLARLRWMIPTGEALAPDLAREWFARYPAIPLLNAYGPTECSDDVAHYPIFEPPSLDVINMPIGKPVINTKLYILDSQGIPVPVGTPGELHVGGVGVGRGYLNDPERTAQAFATDSFERMLSEVESLAEGPFKGEQARLYRTGDLARFLPDGNIEFLGRIDHQVKIRGFRIELGEIEVVLREHPAIQDAVVTVHEEHQQKYLVAYYVADCDTDALTMEDLRSFLGAKLPDYMIPPFMISLEALPLTPNGKINRRALPTPGEMIENVKAAFVAPRDDLERSLVAIWEEVLNVQPIGIHDSFFDLGGHSLLAVRLMPKIQQQTGWDLPLSALLEGGTIEQLAERLRKEADQSEWSPLIRLQAGTAARRPIFCVNPAGGEGLGYYELAQSLGAEQPFYALQAPGLYANQTPYTDIPELAAYLLTEIRTVQPQGPYYLAGHSFGGPVAFELACQLQQQGESVALLALFDSAAPVVGNRTVEIERDLSDDVSWLMDAGNLLARFYDRPFTLVADELASLVPEEQMSAFLQALKKDSLVPEGTDQSFVRGLIEINKAASQSIVKYVEQVQPYAGDIVLFRALELTDDDFRSWERTLQDDPTLGWGQLVNGKIQLDDVPGDHISMLNQPYVETLAAHLRRYLNDES